MGNKVYPYCAYLLHKLAMKVNPASTSLNQQALPHHIKKTAGLVRVTNLWQGNHLGLVLRLESAGFSNNLRQIVRLGLPLHLQRCSPKPYKDRSSNLDHPHYNDILCFETLKEVYGRETGDGFSLFIIFDFLRACSRDTGKSQLHGTRRPLFK